AGHIASLEIAIQDPPGRFELGRVSAVPFVPPALAPVSSVAPSVIAKPPVAVNAPTRATCVIGGLVRPTMRGRVRGVPLTEVAARLRQDMQQTAARSLAFVGIGQSATHEALLYAATLLAEQGSGKVLLVDADSARSRLTEALEYGRERGLGELLKDEISA